MTPGNPVPTLSQLQKQSCWWWLYCDGCGAGRPIALAAYVIRFGPETSSDRIRRGSVCTRCGHKGASLTHPSWLGNEIGWQPFPTERMDSNKG